MTKTIETATTVGYHPHGWVCGSCVGCFCAASPSVDCDGLCSSCGCAPVATAVLCIPQSGPLHIDIENTFSDEERGRIEQFIAECSAPAVQS